MPRLLYTNHYYYLQTAPLFGHLPHRPSSPTLLRNVVYRPDPPLLQYMPYNMGNGNIVLRPTPPMELMFGDTRFSDGGIWWDMVGYSGM